MRKLITYLFLIVPTWLNAQEGTIIRGYIRDSTNNEALIGATVYSPETQKNTDSNNFGYFQITVPAKDFKLMFSYVGYGPKYISISNTRDTIITVLLSSKNDLKEVAVYGTLNDKLNKAQTGVEVISAKAIKSLPVIMGESDIMRTIFLLPGVTFGTENSAGYFVRGGSNDQNLLLIDGVPVYNAYHLYGFFSVFNTDAINKAKLYKGDMPARYGEGLSSLLEIQLKEGNAQKYSAEATLGIVASKFRLEGPIIKGKTSFLITGRRSMMDIIPFGLSDALNRADGLEQTKRDVELTDYHFSDLTSKINHTFSDRSKLFLSFYKGLDDYERHAFNSNSINKINWGNTSSSLRWNYLFSNGLYSNFTFYYSKFTYNTQNEDYTILPSAGVQGIGYSRGYTSGIRDYSGKADFEYSISDHLLKFGLQYISREVKPGVNTFFRSYELAQYNIDTSYNFNKKVNNEILYIEDYFKLFGKLSVSTGMRITGFYTEQKLYPSIQPRLSLNFQPIPVLALKLSYSRVSQNLHMLSTTSLGGPADLWVPATRRVAPSVSDQLTLGITHNINNLFTLNIEAYLKYMNHIIMYKEGASYLIEKNDWQDKIEIGKGFVRGIEFSLNKESGNTTGWISYTLSKSDRTFSNINFGRTFPYTFDRRHNISIALVQKISNKFSIGADWIFATGNAVTLANTFVYNEIQRGEWLKYFNSINNYRMPSYHRLDMCINYVAALKKLKYSVSAGAYNVYNRANPYILLDTVEGIRQQSLFPILPYASLSVKF